MFEEVICVDKIPTLDLHGESADISKVLIDCFIKENIKLKKYNIAIIHGKGTGVLKKVTHEVLKHNIGSGISKEALLKHNKYVLDYKIYYFNDGMTIVKLKK